MEPMSQRGLRASSLGIGDFRIFHGSQNDLICGLSVELLLYKLDFSMVKI